MDIRAQLLLENSKKNWQLVAGYIGHDPTRFAQLMEIYFKDVYRAVQRASQVMSHIADEHPQLLEPYLGRLITHLTEQSLDAERRNTLRIFQELPIPEEHEGELFEKALRFLKSAEEPIAVKAFAMTVLRRICEKYPDLSGEVIPAIEILVSENVSAGIVNRGNKELKLLRKLSQ